MFNVYNLNSYKFVDHPLVLLPNGKNKVATEKKINCYVSGRIRKNKK